MDDDRQMWYAGSMRRRIYFAAWGFAIALTVQFLYHAWNPRATYDMYFPICAAWYLLNGVTPYSGTCIIYAEGVLYPPNPMTTVLVALPFAPLQYIGGIVMWSLLIGLLVYGILGTGERWRLLILTSAPFVTAALTLQWSPLMTALVYLPNLTPLALVKPHTGLPIILTNLSARNVRYCLVFGLLTFAVDPFWVFKWLPQTQVYDGFIPLLVLPFGLPLLIFLWRREWFLFLMSIVPQRGFYDALPLGTAFATPRQLLAWCALTWAGWLLWSWLALPYQPFAVVFCYLPVLAARLPLHSIYPTITTKLREVTTGGAT